MKESQKKKHSQATNSLWRGRMLPTVNRNPKWPTELHRTHMFLQFQRPHERLLISCKERGIQNLLHIISVEVVTLLAPVNPCALRVHSVSAKFEPRWHARAILRPQLPAKRNPAYSAVHEHGPQIAAMQCGSRRCRSRRCPGNQQRRGLQQRHGSCHGEAMCDLWNPRDLDVAGGRVCNPTKRFEPSEENSWVPKTGKWIIWIIHKRNHEIATVALAGAYVAAPTPPPSLSRWLLCPMTPLFLGYWTLDIPKGWLL